MVIPEFFNFVSSDLDDRGNFSVFLIPSLLCVAGLIIYDIWKLKSQKWFSSLGHITVFANFAALAAYLTWLLMASWAAILIIAAIGCLFSSSPSRYVIIRV